ncbi:uncharacterized protein LOC131678289 [Topomyia yanbarensis]|uniref:uncharacterized protein LOC131678289 n=1 Tax=Topomyia yanbarensis TaxID=2498891 RepID=UPI00273B93D1|nr:uncharacterized protein LOC131678289 [Topomyia yanbarensis]
MGEDLQGIVRAAKLRPDLRDPQCYATMVKNIDAHLKSMTDTAAEHEAFMNMRQSKDESAVAFHARLQEKVRLCGYSPNDQERFVRVQLLKGLTNRELAKAARTFGHETIYIVQSATRDEAYHTENATSSGISALAVSQRRSVSDGKFRKRQNRNQDTGIRQRYVPYTNKPGLGRRFRCSKCNRMGHKQDLCPALNKKCNTCGMLGHFAVTCHKKRVSLIQEKQERREPKGWTDDENSNDQHVNALSLSDVLVECRLGSSNPIRMLIDSGADINVIGGDDWKVLKKEYHLKIAQLEPIHCSGNKELRGYASNNPMKINCSFRAHVAAVGLTKPIVAAEFFVVDQGRRSLLGRSTASEMRLLEVGPAVNSCESSDTTGSFPKVPGVKVRFSIDETIPPVRNAYFNVPAAYREAAKSRLTEMEARGIIEKVETAPNWISGMSAVAKGKNDFRLVVNMRAPNRAIKREYFRLPLVDEIKLKLQGSKYYSKLDLSNAFYHLELHKQSRDLTTFLTENGMYRFTRLMFGVNCAPEIFQREMCRLLEGIANIVVYIDDILIFGKSLEEV